jgi:hypothetical protein
MLNDPHHAAARLKQLPLPLRVSAYGAAASLIAEHIGRALLLPLMALLLFAAFGMMGVMTQLPGMLRVALLAALLLWLCISLLRVLRTLKAPSVQTRLRRLEQASALPAGSLLLHIDTATDTPLWQRALSRLPDVRHVPWPRAAHIWRNSYTVAPLLLLLLCAAPLVGGQNSFVHLANSFSPWPTSLADVQIAVVVRPPRYTDLPPQPLMLHGGDHVALSAISGSDVLITVTGISGALHFDDKALATQADGNSHSGAIMLRKNGRYTLRRGWRTIATIDVQLRADGAPQLFFMGVPTITGNQSIDVRYSFVDDYGLRSLMLMVTDGIHAEAQLLPTPQGVAGTGQSWRDLTPSRFAGKKVQLLLVGFDAQGHKASSAPLNFTLPERQFQHPVAQQIIGVRKSLFAPAPHFPSVVAGLDLIARDTHRYNDKLTVFAALRMIGYRLARPEPEQQIDSSAGMLWQTALDLDGAASNATALRAAFEKLQQAMRSGKDANAAIAALQQQLAQFMANQPSDNSNSTTAAINADDINQMLQQMQAQLAAGDTASAQAMLQHLQQMIENAHSGAAESTAASQALQQLRGVTARQQGVMNETAATNISSAIVGADQLQQDVQNLARDQQQLREQLGQIPNSKSGPAAKSLGEAGAAMQQAAGQLRAGAARQALLSQGRAMNTLRAAMGQLQQAGGKGAGGGRRAITDPLGRFNGGALGPEYQLPVGVDPQQAGEIRKLLQQRAADPNRSAAERAYMLRLLKQF